MEFNGEVFSFLMRTLRYIFIAGRYWNMVLTGVSVLIGYYYSTGLFWDLPVLYAGLSAAFICGGGNIINDYFGVESDRINKPHRPYASGKLTGLQMLVSGSVFFVIGFLLSLLLNKTAVSIAVLVVLSILLYNVVLKRIVLIGNILVSVLSGLSFLYGSATGGTLWSAFFPALFSSLFILGREVLKDIEDVEGDSAQNINTFPAKYGKIAAILLSGGIYFILIVLSIMPFIYFQYSIRYLLVVVFGTDLTIAFLFMRYIFSPQNEYLHQMNSLLKIGILFGMIALVLK